MMDVRHLYLMTEVVVGLAVLFAMLKGWLRLPDSRRTVVGLGLGWAALVSLPHWILGPYSYMDWLGDLDYMVPIIKLINAQPPGTRFIHEYAGGHDAYVFGAIAGQYLSVEQILMRLLPPWAASGLHKALLAAIWSSGTYFLARRVAGTDRSIGMALACLATVSYHYASVGSLLFGPPVAMVPLGAYLVVYRVGKRYYWSGVLAFAVFYAIAGAQPPGAIGLLSALPILALTVSVRRLFQTLPALGIITLLILLNWHESLYGMLTSAPFTNRGRVRTFQTLPTNVPEALWGIASVHLEWIVAVGLASIVAVRRHLATFIATHRTIIGLLIFLMFPHLFMLVPFDLIGLSFLYGFPFHYMLLAGSVFFIMVLARLAASRATAPTICAIILAIGLGKAAWAKAYEVTGWFGQAGHRLTELAELRDPPWLPSEPVRMVAVPYRLGENTLAAAGREALDFHFSMGLGDLSSYWAAIIRDDSRLESGAMSLSPRLGEDISKCCATYDIDSYQVSSTLLRIANVGFIASRLPLRGNGVTKVGGPAETEITPREGASLADRLRVSMEWKFTPPEVFVYSLGTPLPRAYGATSIRVVPDGLPLADYFAEIERHGLGRSLIVRQDDAGKLGNTPDSGTVTVRKTTLVQNGLDILVEPGTGGVLAINYTWLPFWNATADGVSLDVVKASGIQMAVKVPPGTTKVEMRYFRPLLRDRIAGWLSR